MTNLITDAVNRVSGVPGKADSFRPLIFDDTENAIQLLALLLLALDLYVIIHGLVRRHKGMPVVGFATTLRVTSIGAMFFIVWVALGELNLHIRPHIPYMAAGGTADGLLIGVWATLRTLRLPLPVIALGFIGAHILELPRRRRKDDDPQQTAGHVR